MESSQCCASKLKLGINAWLHWRRPGTQVDQLGEVARAPEFGLREKMARHYKRMQLQLCRWKDG